MPYKITHTDNGCFICEYEGVVLLEEIRTVQNLVKTDFSTKDKKIKFYVSDWSKGVPSALTTEEVRKFALGARQLIREILELFIVGIAPENTIFGLGRVWHHYMEDDQDRVALFRTREEGDKWIKDKLSQ